MAAKMVYLNHGERLVLDPLTTLIVPSEVGWHKSDGDGDCSSATSPKSVLE